ncbi:5'-AMP-activated serine/threonine-protein kinase catalytic subunit alpha-like [Hylaeus volcanicus]|uniref:5'-AMP-activated serine/threonine-protein kinase catalytic subunit alpha-like n=1 Tax=Hylaeus volcanicus TaxID=313075 RepID=UPI0023B78DF6|nr:5'-AMP-activated serine/threonine-protein kinase catalytic subunit alpha-like [Hylaeus volcanicus]
MQKSFQAGTNSVVLLEKNEESFNAALRYAGVDALSKDNENVVLNLLTLFYFLARFNLLEDRHRILKIFSKGVETPNWVSDSLKDVYTEAQKQGDTLFEKFVPVALTLTRYDSEQTLSLPLQVLAFQGGCLFNTLETGSAGSNNAVAHGFIVGNATEKNSVDLFHQSTRYKRITSWPTVKLHRTAVKILSKKNIIKKGAGAIERCMEEIKIAKKVSHDAIIRTLQVCEAYNLIFLVMDFANAGDLVSAIRQSGCFTEKEACHIFSQIVSGLTYLHGLSIIHRDIKPENILLQKYPNSLTNSIENCQAMLADFGAAVDVSDKTTSVLSGTVGTLAYAAPEILGGAPYEAKPVDVWSLGVVLFAMVYGKLPWTLENKSISEAFFIHKTKSYTIPLEREIHGPVSRECRHLITNLIRLNPSNRITLNEIKMHPWMVNKFPPIRSVKFNWQTYPIEKRKYPNFPVVLDEEKIIVPQTYRVPVNSASTDSLSFCETTTVSAEEASLDNNEVHRDMLKQVTSSYNCTNGSSVVTSAQSTDTKTTRCNYKTYSHSNSECFENDGITVRKAARYAAQYIATAAVDILSGLRSIRRTNKSECLDVDKEINVNKPCEIIHKKVKKPEEIFSNNVKTKLLSFGNSDYHSNQALQSSFRNKMSHHDILKAKIPPLNISLYNTNTLQVQISKSNLLRSVVTHRDNNNTIPYRNHLYSPKNGGSRTERIHPYASPHSNTNQPWSLTYDRLMMTTPHIPYGYTLRSLTPKASPISMRQILRNTS